MCMGRKDSCNVCFPMGSHTRQGEKPSCFPVHALPHLSMLLGLRHRRLRWCPQGCFTGAIFVCGKGKALPLCHVPLYPIAATAPSLGWWSSGETPFVFLSSLAKAALPSIHCWSAGECSSIRAPQLNAELPSFRHRGSIRSWRSQNSLWGVLCQC